MNKKHFALKLNPCRPDFAQTMTDAERKTMHEHVEYWKTYLDRGIMLIFGPVFDPKGTYGFGIVEVDNEEQVKELIAHDPAQVINTYEYYPMRAVFPPRS
jgi:uncharacterized protein YciI